MWYRKLPLPGSVSQRTRASASRDVQNLRIRNRITARKPEHAFYKAFSNTVAISGYRVKLSTRYQIAKLFNIGLPAIMKWEKLGVLPSPVMYQQRGAHRHPVYLASQVRCLVMVVNDIVIEGGYLSIPWKYLPDHIEMLHEGYAHALLGFQRRAGYFDDEPLGDEQRPDSFGVVFD